jgi:hypothetical protein
MFTYQEETFISPIDEEKIEELINQSKIPIIYIIKEENLEIDSKNTDRT